MICFIIKMTVGLFVRTLGNGIRYIKVYNLFANSVMHNIDDEKMKKIAESGQKKFEYGIMFCTFLLIQNNAVYHHWECSHFQKGCGTNWFNSAFRILMMKGGALGIWVVNTYPELICRTFNTYTSVRIR
jgi:hypothetical protein